MAVQKLIAVKEICLHHNISHELINELYQHDVIELITIKRTRFIEAKKLYTLEMALRLYNELSINIEGIPAILHLLAVLDKKEDEVRMLRNRLAFYDPE